MKLSLKNIGKIRDASVEINGITVIAGENNSGKSTIGRALFSVFNSFFNIRKQIESEQIGSIENLLQFIYMEKEFIFDKFPNIYEIAKAIVSDINEYRQMTSSDIQLKIMNLLSRDDDGTLESFNQSKIDEIVSRIKAVLNVSDMEFLKSILMKNLAAEFNGQICNIFSEDDGEIQLQIKNDSIIVSVENKGGVKIQNSGNLSFRTEVVYIDDPFVLDDIRLLKNSRFITVDTSGHRGHLCIKLSGIGMKTNVFEKIIAEDKFKNIYKKLSSVCNGDIISHKPFTVGYQRKGSDKILDVRNLSTGFKTFVILKMLLTEGVIETNGIIILDEPEIHLHPEWQLLFAELIVLIQKEFAVHVLLNTHSPYFLNAIEVYSAKYGVDNKCKYYLASSEDDIFNIRDVTDNIEAIYKKLARPLQDLENERGRLYD